MNLILFFVKSKTRSSRTEELNLRQVIHVPKEHGVVGASDRQQEDRLPGVKLDLHDAGEDELDEEVRHNHAVEGIRGQRVLVHDFRRLQKSSECTLSTR